MKIATRMLYVSALVLAAAATAAHADSGKSREQVRAELAAAMQAGTVSVGFQGMTPRELFPDLYPAAPAQPGKSREQVRAELAAALRAGTVSVAFQGMTPRELFPDLYAKADASRSVAHASTPAKAY